MTTTIKIDSIADLDTNLLNRLIKEFILSVGNAEISIKPQMKYNPELLQRNNEIENGGVLYSFTSDEFDEMSEKLINGEQINKSKLTKVRKDEKGNFISA